MPKRKQCPRRGLAGQSLVEYGLILALIALLAITALKTLGGSISNAFESISGQIASATASGGSGSGAMNTAAARPAFMSASPNTMITNQQAAPRVAGISLYAVTPATSTASTAP